MDDKIVEKIRRRRRQMLVHSYIYYELDTNIISDWQWAQWAQELRQLQEDYPEESKAVEFYEMFKDWDGSSGAHLSYTNAIKDTARRLLEYHGRNN